MAILISPSGGGRQAINTANFAGPLITSSNNHQITGLTISNNLAVLAHYVGICDTTVPPVTGVTQMIASVRNTGTANAFSFFDREYFRGRNTNGYTVVRSSDALTFIQLGAPLGAPAFIEVNFDLRKGLLN
jgi:subtilase family serine protease